MFEPPLGACGFLFLKFSRHHGTRVYTTKLRFPLKYNNHTFVSHTAQIFFWFSRITHIYTHPVLCGLHNVIRFRDRIGRIVSRDRGSLCINVHNTRGFGVSGELVDQKYILRTEKEIRNGSEKKTTHRYKTVARESRIIVYRMNE